MRKPDHRTFHDRQVPNPQTPDPNPQTPEFRSGSVETSEASKPISSTSWPRLNLAILKTIGVP